MRPHKTSADTRGIWKGWNWIGATGIDFSKNLAYKTRYENWNKDSKGNYKLRS